MVGALGMEAHLQPLKNIMRWKSQGENRCWSVPEVPDKTVFLKETLGPYSEAEARFNPLQLLIDAGYPTSQLQLIILGRTPLETWLAWRYWWGDKTNIDIFIQAYICTESIRQQALKMGIPVTTLVYEAFRDYTPEAVARRICTRIGLPFRPAAVKGWRDLPEFGTPGSHIVIPDMPPNYVVPDIRTRVTNADHFSYLSRKAELASLSVLDSQRIRDEGVLAVYEVWRRACETNLGLSIPP